MRYDYLIVGSGLYGAAFAYKAKNAGKRCLVIEKRKHLGGNLYCEQVEGINVHKYGAHIFHTSNKKVWDFVNSIVEFNHFTNSPIANYKGEIYNLPFNMNTFNRLWGVQTPQEAMNKLDEQRKEVWASLKGREPSNLEEQALLLVGRDIYQKFIKEYTEKQWGRSCKDLPVFIIKRIPFRLTFDNNYFDDLYQGVPIGGYNRLIEGLLEGVETRTNVDFFSETMLHYDGSDAMLKDNWKEIANCLVYTGPLDQYFGCQAGKLDWRTLSFKTRLENVSNFQGNAVVNYTSHEQKYTRVIEHKHFEKFGQSVYDSPKTVVTEEYPAEYSDEAEPFYPVNDEKNNQLASYYLELAQKEEDVIFGGRLGRYEYYDMDKLLENLLGLNISSEFDKLIV